MKEIIKSSRLLGALEKLYRKINADWFDNELEDVVLSVTPTPRAYGHLTVNNAWNVKGEGRRELNISSAALDRPIEDICATLVHEMCHLLNIQRGIVDVSRNGMYHNSKFRDCAEAHGLVIGRDPRYGWTITEPGDALVEWILTNGIEDIMMIRSDPGGLGCIGGSKAASGGAAPTGRKPSSTRKLICPCCGQSVRATKSVFILCGVCMERMVEVN